MLAGIIRGDWQKIRVMSLPQEVDSMKSLLIFLFLTILSLLFAMAMDVLIGLGAPASLQNLANLFWIMSPAEYILVIFLLIVIVFHFAHTFKHAKETKR
jgi:hypothetical protein